MRSLLLLPVLLVFACADVLTPTIEDPEEDAIGGKGDEFSDAENHLTITGDVSREITFEAASQCEITQWGIISTWQNPAGWEDIDFPMLRFSISDMQEREAGLTWDLSQPNGRLIFDGSGYSSEQGACTAELVAYFNDTEDAGVRIYLSGCVLVDSNDHFIWLTGDLSCRGAGFTPVEIPTTEEPVEPVTTPEDPIEDPEQPDEPEDACEDAIYLEWAEHLQTTLDSVGSVIDEADRASLDDVLADRPCLAESDTAYAWWLAWFKTALQGFGSNLDETDSIRAEYVLAAKPATISAQSFVDWLHLFVTELDSYGQILDDNDQAFLALVKSARPAASDDVSYKQWLQAYVTVMNDVGEIVSEQDAAKLDTYIEVQPASTSEPSYWEWLQAYQEEVEGAGLTINENENVRLDYMMFAKPCLHDDELSESEDDYMSFQQAFDDGSDDSVVNAVLQAAPAVCE